VKRRQPQGALSPTSVEGSVEIRRVPLPRPHPAQATVIREAARFNVVTCGRRWGKSTLGIDRLIAPALEGKPVAWCSPTYRMMAELLGLLKHLLAGVIEARSEQEHQLILRGGGTIDLWSLEDPDTVRGRAYARVVIDEAAQIRDLQRAWEQVLRPCLTDYQGDAWFLSTPKSLKTTSHAASRRQQGLPAFLETVVYDYQCRNRIGPPPPGNCVED
jgi:hypothetical protein